MDQEERYSGNPHLSERELQPNSWSAAPQPHKCLHERRQSDMNGRRLQNAYKVVTKSRTVLAINTHGIQTSFSSSCLSSSFGSASAPLLCQHPWHDGHASFQTPTSAFRGTAQKQQHARGNNSTGTNQAEPMSSGSGAASLDAFHCGTSSFESASIPAGSRRIGTCRHAGMKRKAGQQGRQQLEQILTLSLEELYCGCVKRMLLSHHVPDSATGAPKLSQEVLEITVSPGWREGTRITFHGKAESAPGSSGTDIVFVVREDLHPRYQRRGDDLFTRVSVPLVTALTGGSVDLLMLDQRRISLPISDIIAPHTERLIQGEGMPRTRHSGQKGDLHVIFDITFPEALSPVQRQLIRSAFEENDQRHADKSQILDGDRTCGYAPCDGLSTLASTAEVAARSAVLSALQICSGLGAIS